MRTVACSMDLSEKEILIVCPERLTPAKRFEKAAMLAGAIRTVSGKSTGLIFCDFPSADIPALVYKSMIRTEGKKAGLADGDLLFTSDLGFFDGFPGRRYWNCSGSPICSSVRPFPSPSA